MLSYFITKCTNQVRKREDFSSRGSGSLPLGQWLLFTTLVIMLMFGRGAWAENELPNIVMKISPLSGDAPLTVELDATESYDSDGSITEYVWSSNDEQEVIGRTGSMLFSKEGVYAIGLKVRDNNGGISQRTALVFVDRESCPGATAFDFKKGLLPLPVIHIVADPVIGSFIEPSKILSTVNADLKLNQNTGLLDIIRFGQDDGSLEGISGGNPATYALSNTILTIPSIDLPVRSTIDNKVITLGTNTYGCSAQLQADSGSFALVGCMPSVYRCVTTMDIGFDSSPSANSTINFGRLPVDESSDKEIRIFSTGKFDLEIKSIAIIGSDANHFSVSTPELTIAGNEKETVVVTCQPQDKGKFKAILDLTTNTKKQSNVQYDLVCEGEEADVIFHSIPMPEEKPIDFGTVVVNSISEREVTVINRSKGILEVQHAQIIGNDADSFSITPTGAVLNEGEKQEFGLTCLPTAEGKYTAILQMLTNDTNQPEVSYRLSCTGSIDQPIFISTPTAGDKFNFGKVDVGETEKLDLAIGNEGVGELEISPAQITGKDANYFNVLPKTEFSLTGESMDVQILEVSCTPKSAKSYTATLNFRTNDPEQKNVSYPLSCFGQKDSTDDGSTITSDSDKDDSTDNSSDDSGKDDSTDNSSDNSGKDDSTDNSSDDSGKDDSTDNSSDDSGKDDSTDNSSDDSDKDNADEGDSNINININIDNNNNNENNNNNDVTIGQNGGTSKPIDPPVELPKFSSIPSVGHLMNFGSLLEGSLSAKQTINVSNHGNAVLNITNIEILGSHASYFILESHSSFAVGKNSTAEQTISVSCQPDIGYFTAELVITSNDSSSPHRYSLVCEGKAVIIDDETPIFDSTPIDSTIDFGDVQVDSSSTSQPVTIMNRGDAALEVSAIEIKGSDADSFVVNGDTSFSIAGNSTDKKVLNMTCQPKQAGNLSATLEIASNDSNSPHEYSLVCEGEPIIIDDEPIFDSTPAAGSSFQFSAKVGETSAQQPITISNTGDVDLTVSNIQIDSDVFTVSNSSDFTLSGGSSKTLQLSCIPSSKGTFTGELTLSHNGSDKNVEYSLSCQGTDDDLPIFTSSPTPGSDVSFGNVGFNSEAIPATQDIVIKNGGLKNLTVDYFNIEGKDAGIFDVVSSTSLDIEPSKMDKMTVQCAPKTSGNFSATLKLSSNDPKLPTPDYQLQCSGDDCLVDIDLDKRPQGGVGDLGFGYDSDRDLFKLTCLEGSTSTATGLPGGSVDLDKSYTFTEILDEMGFSANAKVKAKVFELEASATFAMQRKDTSLSQSLFFKADYKLPNGVFHPSGLTSIADSIKHNSCQFRNSCGDEYVNQLVRGAKLYVAVTFSFSEQKYKKSFDAMFKGKYKILDIASKLNTLDSELKQAGNISISAIQVGGEVEKLAEILGGSKSEVAPVIQCSFDKLSQCEQMINQIYQYAQNQFADGAKTQPATIGYYTLPYTTIPGAPNDKTKVTAEILEARKYLADTYKIQYADLQVVRGWDTNYGGQMSDSQLEEIRILETLLTNNTNMLQLAGMWCLSNLEICEAKKEKAKEFVEANPYILPELELDDRWESEARGIVWSVSDYSGDVNGQELSGITTNEPHKIRVDGNLVFPSGTTIYSNASLYIEATGNITVEKGASLSVKSTPIDGSRSRNILVLNAGKTLDVQGVLNNTGDIGKSGKNGNNGAKGPSAGSCEMGKSGYNGTHGTDGQPGKDGGLIYLKANTIKGNVRNVIAAGGVGGKGGDGGNGGRGSDGREGYGCFMGCRSGGGGGHGGNGGNSGDGGNGGAVVLRYCQSHATGTPKIFGANAGLKGNGGSGGSGGSRTGTNCKNGSTGKSGASGQTGKNGMNGEYALVPISSEICQTWE